MATGPMGTSAEELKLQLVSEEKFLEDRVNHVEHRVSALALDLGGMARKMARLRDKGDNIAKTLHDFAISESGTMKRGLEGLAECLLALDNSQQLQIDKMEAKVVKPLLEYGTVCKKAKGEIRATQGSWEKEVNKQRRLERIRLRDPANRKKISEIESDIQKTRVERLRTFKAVEDYMENFERKRTQDLKKYLGEFITCHLAHHAKAMELFTLAYEHVQNINEEETVERFHQGLNPRKHHLYRTASEPSLTASSSNHTTHS